MTNVTPRTLAVRSTAIPEFLGAPALEPVRLTGTRGSTSSSSTS